MARKLRPALNIVSDIGSLAFDLQHHSNEQIAEAVAILHTVNPEMFDWLVERLAGGSTRTDPGVLGAATAPVEPKLIEAQRLDGAVTLLEQLQAQGFYLCDRRGVSLGPGEFMAAVVKALGVAALPAPEPRPSQPPQEPKA